MSEVWLSPRKIADQERAYIHKRFEDYMVMVDTGELDIDTALLALESEIAYSKEIDCE